MDRVIYTAMTGASQLMDRQAAVAHNLANVSTTGYRAEEHRLRAVQVQTHNTPAALPTRAFVVDASTYTNFSAGTMQFTGRTLDASVNGKGWFTVSLPDGSEAYTRNGAFSTDINGVVQNQDGLPVMGDTGPITVPPDSKITLGADGTISVIPATGSQNTTNVIGRLKMVNPAENTLVRGADGLFRTKDGTAAPLDESVRLSDGYLEGSNVSPVDQMVSMISLSRQFEMQMQVLTNAQANDRSASQMINAA